MLNNKQRLTAGWASTNSRQIKADALSKFGDCRALTPAIQRATWDRGVLLILLSQSDPIYAPAQELARALIAELEK